MKKTNVMRILEQHQIDYEAGFYSVADEQLDAVSVARKIGRKPDTVYKTLVTKGEKDYFVFVIPGNSHLDLKKAATAAGQKRIEMIAQKDLKSLTGYIHGGCSPIGLKKQFPIFFEETVQLLDDVAISAGQIGAQVIVQPQQIAAFLNAKFADLI